jgi:hypothetical protein
LSSDLTISERLAKIGIRHERDSSSSATGKHRLYFNEEYLGDFTADEAAKFLNTGKAHAVPTPEDAERAIVSCPYWTGEKALTDPD